jgi:hypothetical protein
MKMMKTQTIKILTIALLFFAGLGVTSTANAHPDKLQKKILAKVEMKTTIPAWVLHHYERSLVEDWMLSSSYLGDSVNIEDWMMDEEYFDEASMFIEEWMMDEAYLGDEATTGIESWMLNPEYLTR